MTSMVLDRYIVCVLGAISLLLAGCATTHTQRDAVGSKVRSTDVTAYGRRINLRAVDVPLFVTAKFPRSRLRITGPFGPAVEKCDGIMVSVGEVGGITSDRFEDVRRERSEVRGFPIYSVQSGVYVMGNSRLAHREVLVAGGARGQECLRQAVLSANPVITSEGAKVGEPSLSKVVVSQVLWRVRGKTVYGLRTTANTVTATAGARGGPNFYQDLSIFAVGRVIVVLNAVGSPHPFGLEEEYRLVSVLYSRATSGSA